MKRKVITAVVIILAVMLAGSGWFYNFARSRKSAEDLEMAQLNSSFIQQYSKDATVKQLTSQSKVYVAIWTDKDNVIHVSWNVGGLWVTVYVGTPTASVPAIP